MAQDDGVKVSKARTAKGKRALEKRAPKEVEDAKRVLLLQGNKVSQTVKDVLSDLAMVKRGEAFKMTRKNPVWPFEAGHETSLQFFCERADCGLFCLGNHNNKRPHNLVLGRVFNAQLLDMIELGVERHVPISACKAGKHVLVGSKPCFAFVGTAFESDERFKLAKSLLLDLFRGQEVSEMSVMAISHVYVCSAAGAGMIRLRHYAVRLLKSGTKIPRVALELAGPSLDLSIRRTRAAQPDVLREALVRPVLGKRKKKNVGFEETDGKVGRIYMPSQDLAEVAQAKGKGVKRARRAATAARKGAAAPAADGDDSMDDSA